jgi:hypothetical protein
MPLIVPPLLAGERKRVWTCWGKDIIIEQVRQYRLTSLPSSQKIVFIAGIRVGLVRRVRFGTSCEAAVAAVFDDLPKGQTNRLLVVDAVRATQQQFAAATEQNALVERLRTNCKLRCAPVLQEKGKRGRPPKHGAVLHPGSESPEIEPREDFTVIEEEKEISI